MAYRFRHGDRPLDGFTIQRGVGRGGFGEVYYAMSDGGREVALKYLRDNPDIELRGVSNCMNLNSPHLVQIFDIKKNAEGEYFIVMEYIHGPSLRDMLIAEPKGIGPQKAAFFVRELAKGLSFLHSHGIVHRDMKPGNVFYEEGYVKICDYGLSKCMSVSRHSMQTASVGTVHYMAPEIGSGNYHRGIDIYALGVMLYEMVMGKVPYEGSTTAEVLMKHLTGQPEVDDLPQPFGRVIRKALEKDPKDRYQTVDEMAEDLLEVEEVRTSLANFDTVSLSEVAKNIRPRINEAESPTMSLPYKRPQTPPPYQAQPAAASQQKVDIGAAFRDLADVTGDALKAAAAGVPMGTPAGQAPVLSPEAATGQLVYAGFWIRALAVFIDAVIVGMACSLIGMGHDGEGGMLLLYQIILIGAWKGQTLGKRACNLRVINANGCYPTLGQSFGRGLSKILSFLILLFGYFMVLFDENNRALHDRHAGRSHSRVKFAQKWLPIPELMANFLFGCDYAVMNNRVMKC